jgi:hypothetical protein
MRQTPGQEPDLQFADPAGDTSAPCDANVHLLRYQPFNVAKVMEGDYVDLSPGGVGGDLNAAAYRWVMVATPASQALDEARLQADVMAAFGTELP